MKYEPIVQGTFLSRPNRFIARVLIEGKEEVVHVKNTGRCKELLIEGVPVILQKAQNPDRKTAWDLVSVYKEGLGWVNIDSQACNDLAAQWMDENTRWSYKREVKHGNSRFDFLITKEDGTQMYAEVKGCTLETDGKGYFPDAPTQRGQKHVKELCELARQGQECLLLFVIQMESVTNCRPNLETDPQFASALAKARKAGMHIWHGQCSVQPERVRIEKMVSESLLFKEDKRILASGRE